MKLPKINTTIKYDGKICEVKSLGNKAVLLEEGKKKAFSIDIVEFSKIYEEELPQELGGNNDDGDDGDDGNTEIKDMYATHIADGEDHSTAVTNTAEKMGISEAEVEAEVEAEAASEEGGDEEGGDEEGGDEEGGDEEGGDEEGGDEEEKADEDGNFGIPPSGVSTAVKKLPNIREFLAEKAYERKIYSIVNEGDIFRSIGKIKNVPIFENLEDKPAGEEGAKTSVDPDNTDTPSADDPNKNAEVDPKLKVADPIDISKGDTIGIQSVDPTNKKVIAKHGDMEIELSTDDFAEKGAILEKVNEEEENEFGDQISKINTWFEGEGGYTDADSFEWDGTTLTVTKADGSTETKSKADLGSVLEAEGEDEGGEESEEDKKKREADAAAATEE